MILKLKKEAGIPAFFNKEIYFSLTLRQSSWTVF